MNLGSMYVGKARENVDTVEPEEAPADEPQSAERPDDAPPCILVEHADGQTARIPVDYSHTIQVIDPFGAIKATVALSGVEGLELEL